MAAYFLLGASVLAGLWLLGQWFARTQPKTIVKAGKWGLLAAGLLVVALLAVSGRLGWALAALAGLVPWGLRLLQAHALFRGMQQQYRRARGGRRRQGGQSAVETAWLSMTLDHDTGNLDGVVLAGALQGRRLSTLDEPEALVLWRELQADEESRQVLEAWLERTYPDWRPAARMAQTEHPADMRSAP